MNLNNEYDCFEKLQSWQLEQKTAGLVHTEKWNRCKLEIITSMKMKYIDEKNENLGQIFWRHLQWCGKKLGPRLTRQLCSLLLPLYACNVLARLPSSANLIVRKNYGYTRGFQSNLVALVTKRISWYWRVNFITTSASDLEQM